MLLSNFKLYLVVSIFINVIDIFEDKINIIYVKHNTCVLDCPWNLEYNSHKISYTGCLVVCVSWLFFEKCHRVKCVVNNAVGLYLHYLYLT